MRGASDMLCTPCLYATEHGTRRCGETRWLGGVGEEGGVGLTCCASDAPMQQIKVLGHRVRGGTGTL